MIKVETNCSSGGQPAGRNTIVFVLAGATVGVPFMHNLDLAAACKLVPVYRCAFKEHHALPVEGNHSNERGERPVFAAAQLTSTSSSTAAFIIRPIFPPSS